MVALDSQTFEWDKKVWRVTRLIKLAEDLKPFEIPIKCLNIYNLYPKITSTKNFIEHIKHVLNADLKYPIILDDEGYVMDGRHRIAKALLEEKESILAVRFEETPPCCFEKVE